jgi:hypothetical protein
MTKNITGQYLYTLSHYDQIAYLILFYHFFNKTPKNY